MSTEAPISRVTPYTRAEVYGHLQSGLQRGDSETELRAIMRSIADLDAGAPPPKGCPDGYRIGGAAQGKFIYPTG